MQRLIVQLNLRFYESERLDKVINNNLVGIGYEL